MNNKFSDGHYDKENEKNDEETRVPSSQKAGSSTIKDNPFGKNHADNCHSPIESNEKVAENVKGGPQYRRRQWLSYPPEAR
jgi:hypothetical protein